MSVVQLLDWREISTAPDQAGVYAWYAKIQISHADLKQFEEQIFRMKSEGKNPADYIAEKLDQLIFRRYKEDNYLVQLSGALKPRYIGEAIHQPSLSSGLLERLAEKPERFRTIAAALENAAPAFTAPLYIGMATSLRQRLTRHKSLIEKLLDARGSSKSIDSDEGDAGFAKQIVARRFDPTNLFVHIRPIDVSTNEQVDVENILNRINFPIFGRN